jgi:hypothetical protein
MAQLDAAAVNGFEKLPAKAKFAYKWHDRIRAAASLNFTNHSTKSSIYLDQKPLNIILEILRRRGQEDPILAGYVKESSSVGGAEGRSGPDSKANSRILKALAVKIYLIANGRTNENNKPIGYREAIEAAIDDLAAEFGVVPKSGINVIEKLLTNMVFSIFDEKTLRERIKTTVVHVGEVLICDEKLWFYSGEADGWVRLVISKPDRVGHWFYLAVVKLSNGKYYVVYFRLHRVENKLANQQGSLPVDEIGQEWLSLLHQSDPEVAEPFLIADGYYMSEAMRERIKESGRAAIIAVPPERWPSMIQLLEGDLKKAGDSSSFYIEATDEVQYYSRFSCTYIEIFVYS